MKKSIIVLSILVCLLIIFFILNYLGLLVFLNQPLNKIVAGIPNKNCDVDSDCAVKKTTCHVCDCGDAVNKNWNTFCILKKSNERLLCKMCPSLNHDFNIKCAENQCQRVWKNITGYAKIPYEDIELKIINYSVPGCDVASWGTLHEIVINTPADYDSFLKTLYSKGYDSFQYHLANYPDVYISISNYTYNQFFDMCNMFPQIDFSQKTLLGMYMTGGGCSVNFEKQVYRDDENKKIIYFTRVIEKGSCEISFGGMQWITIPKIPSDYDIEFKVEKIKLE